MRRTLLSLAPVAACMPPAARKRQRSPSVSSSSYWVISSSPSHTPSTHHRPQWSWIGVPCPGAQVIATTL